MSTDLSAAELSRYSRHLLLPEIGADGQQRLKGTRVLVIGAGGLGSPVALYLAAAGIGTLGIADFDTVAAHNLQRQLLHDDSAVGQSKSASAVARLRQANPLITVVEHPEAVTAVNAVALFSSYDIIVDGTDNFSTRYLVNDAAVLTRRPLVSGSIFKFEGQVSVYAPHLGGPCHRCLFPTQPEAGTVPNCGEAGVIGALCGVIGSVQAMEALKLAAGFGEPLIGRLFTYDALTQRVDVLTLPRDPGCMACGTGATLRELKPDAYVTTCAAPPSPAPVPEFPLEISVDESKQLLDADPDGVLVLDVREPYELAICRIPGAEHIPMRQIPERIESLPSDRQILVLCHIGGRSLRVTEYLRANGFPRAINIAGGIDAWAERIDPALARY